MQCDHQDLFTTFARVQVTPNGLKPPGKSTSNEYPLPWDPESNFYFRMSKPTMWNGNFTIDLVVDAPGLDLEVSMWTENDKGNVLAGKKDEFSGIVEPQLAANTSTAFVCAKVRTIDCKMCAMADELRSQCNEDLRSVYNEVHNEEHNATPFAARPWTVQQPKPPVKCAPYVQAMNDDWAGNSKPLKNSHAQHEDLWNENEDAWQQPAEGDHDRWDEDEVEDDYVPLWKRAPAQYHAYPSPPDSTNGWEDHGREYPPAGRYHANAMNDDW